MNIFLFSALCIFSLPAHSQDEGFQVEVDPSVYSKEAFQQKDVNASEKPMRAKRPDALPGKGEREAAFAKVAGLALDVAKMDELDRDLLFVRARTKPLKELQKAYPGIEATKLAKLREVVLAEFRKTTAK
jgi:hypothetical protein